VQSQKKNIFKVLAVFAILLFVIASSKNIPNLTRIKIVDLSSPVLNAFHNVTIFLKRLVPFSDLREENRILRARIDLLNGRIEEAKVIRGENQRLKALLEFRKFVPYATMPAQVIGRDPSNWSNSLIIDKGSEHGIRTNKAVISTRGLVGRVIEVGRCSSRVLLISDPNSKVGVLIQRTRHGGILTGRPDGKCKMIYIAPDSDILRGDRVITAGFSGIFPKDILVGEISGVGKEPGRLYKYAIIKPAQDLSRLEEVLCIK